MLGNEDGGDVQIVLCQGQEHLLFVKGLMDQNSCVIIVEFGMQSMEKYQSGDGVCMHPTKSSSNHIILHPNENYQISLLKLNVKFLHWHGPGPVLRYTVLGMTGSRLNAHPSRSRYTLPTFSTAL